MSLTLKSIASGANRARQFLTMYFQSVTGKIPTNDSMARTFNPLSGITLMGWLNDGSGDVTELANQPFILLRSGQQQSSRENHNV